jgi:hypothetical protein
MDKEGCEYTKYYKLSINHSYSYLQESYTNVRVRPGGILTDLARSYTEKKKASHETQEGFMHLKKVS